MTLSTTISTPSTDHNHPATTEMDAETNIPASEELEREGFESFGLPESILAGVQDAGFTNPSPIQSLAIPAVMSGRDVLAQARTGTGKTAAFGLPAMGRLLKAGLKPSKTAGVKILVMAPTRELAMQVSDEIFKLGRHAGMRTAAIYGGQSSMRQVELVNLGTPVVVATPGRLLDLLESGRLKRFEPEVVVLDEADEMLDTGFLEDIEKIFEMLPKQRQTLMFSATMPPAIKRLAETILKEPEFIDITAGEKIPKSIEQSFYVVEENERRDALIRLIDTEEPERAIVFCRTKLEVDELQTALAMCNYNVKALHGDMDQSMRQEIIRRFRAGQTRFLVATDVAARGLGVVGVTHVFNYHMPFHREAYIHRIGRTGRAGQTGKAMTLVTPSEYVKLKRIQDAVKANFLPKQIPDIHAVQKKLDSEMLAEVSAQEPSSEAIELLAQLESTMDLSQIACRLISLLQSTRKARGPQQIGFSEERLQRLVDRKKSPHNRKPRFDSRRPRQWDGRTSTNGSRGRPPRRAGQSRPNYSKPTQSKSGNSKSGRASTRTSNQRRDLM